MIASVDYSALKIEYPNFPVVQKREAFLALLKAHQVIIVKADTGSGKSTQLPKFLLESGLASQGRIGVTQPRRLAALSIADRLREELKDESLVATRIRFLEEGPAAAPIKVMTDGILLQEFRRDRLFKQYSAIMIDEAHERSLNIDILLGIFKQVVAKRPDFHLIIASATLDAKLFESFYDNACVLEAEGRMFPVEVVYRDPQLDAGKTKGDSGLIEEARDAILDLMTLVGKDHLLCFLPTERDIQDLAAELKPELDEKTFDILPLFGRMSPAEQRRVFYSTGKTRVVLATNIAETSLTIPGIAYVVDTGSARVSRYNPQSRIQGLPIEAISQASARQRMGRAGRVKPGFCVRLYSEESYNEREEFTEPEIRRSNLANVVLQLRSLGLAIEDFPFLQAPPRSAFRGAYRTLHELGALTHGEQGADVTSLGEEMAGLPMDVALSAVLLRARDAGVLQPAIIVCAGLSIQDPRLFPSEDPDRQKARDCHRKSGGHKSDFLTYLAVWNSFNREWKGGSWNPLRKFCEKNWLHFMRCREWIDLYEQFARILKVDFKDRVCGFDSFHRDNLHIALLSGFLGGVARRDIENGCYRLVGGRESHVFPGSDLFGKSVEWLFSAEVRETSRVFLTKACEIKPEWIIQVAGQFCTRRWYEPRWNAERGFVEAVEEVTFRSMVLTRGRRVDYGRVNPEDCAQIFFRDAVVMGDMPRSFPFMEYNNRVLEGLRGLEARERRWGLAPSEDAQVQYLVGKAPGVNSIKTLRDFIEKNTDKVLRFDAEAWIKASGTGVEHLELLQNVPVLTRRPGQGKVQVEPAHGGTVEFFQLFQREIRGELVFDASREWDGLSLEIPMDMIPLLTPGILANHISKWRDWMEESFIRELPKTLHRKGIQQKDHIDDRFCELLEMRAHESPLLLLYEAFAGINDFAEHNSVLNPDKEHHLRLHLTFIQKTGNQKFSLELSPEWGIFHWFEALRPVVTTAKSDLPVGLCRYGWRLGKAVPMFPEESFFWQNFLHRVEKSSPKSYESVLGDRLTFLEAGIPGIAEDYCRAPREWVLKSLLADLDISDDVPASARALEGVLDRFTGLEFGHGKKMRHFKELSQATGDAENQIRAGLVQLVWDSGLLGLSFFIRGWSLLRENISLLRRGESIRDDYEKIALALPKSSSIYHRLVLIAHFWGAEIEHLETIPDRLPLPTVKELRERFRPSFTGRFLKDSELRAGRDVLSQLERSGDDDAYFELWLRAELQLEEFALLRFKRGFSATSPEETIEVSALAKLKGQFGRL
jgi:RNA helicase HrpA